MQASNSKTSSCSVEGSQLSPPVGDYIAVESCLDLKGNDDVSEEEESRSLSEERRRVERDQKFGKSGWSKKGFPPPIPLLARTENLSSHMPWVFKRYYTNDGRLILKEERVKHHEYFLAQRRNGRLTLHLIPLDHEVNNYPPCSLQEAEAGDDEAIDFSSDEGEADEVEEEIAAQVNNEHDEEVKEEIENDNYVVNHEHEEDQRSNSSNNNGGLGGNLSTPSKCLNYNTVIQASTCIFQMPVPALRPVHT